MVGVPLDALRVACAGLLDDRGRRREALALVASTRSVAGMMLAAELHAAQGELPKAVSMIERVLARAIDTPGAAERHERWSTQLGRRARSETVDDAATVVAPSAAKSEKKGKRAVTANQMWTKLVRPIMEEALTQEFLESSVVQSARAR